MPISLNIVVAATWTTDFCRKATILILSFAVGLSSLSYCTLCSKHFSVLSLMLGVLKKLTLAAVLDINVCLQTHQLFSALSYFSWCFDKYTKQQVIQMNKRACFLSFLFWAAGLVDPWSIFKSFISKSFHKYLVKNYQCSLQHFSILYLFLDHILLPFSNAELQ